MQISFMMGLDVKLEYYLNGHL